MKSLLFFVLFSTFALGDSLLINGAGATFPYPLYSKWFSVYHDEHPNISINYQSIGSGGGIRQLLDGTVDFGASDAPMSDEELGKAKTPVVHIPTTLGAVAISFNIPGVKSLKLTSETLSEIYMGKITQWNDPKLTKDNPKLPNLPIMVTYRSDGSGTTSIFTDYLTKVSSGWSSQVGAGKSVKWPTGLGGKGNEGVAGLIKQNQGSIGYVELIYSLQNNLSIADLMNKAGKYVKPSIESVTKAAQGSLKDIPSDFRVSITNAEGKESYPISSFTYLLVYQEMPNPKGMEIIKFLNWAVTKGQNYTAELHYSPLPKPLVEKVKAKIKTLKSKQSASANG
jgi:phosphate transport system substrate-binding protein